MIYFILKVLFFLFYVGLYLTVAWWIIAIIVDVVKTIRGKNNDSRLPREIRRGLRGW